MYTPQLKHINPNTNPNTNTNITIKLRNNINNVHNFNIL